MPRPQKPTRLGQISGSKNWYIFHHDGKRDCRLATGTGDRQEAERILSRFIEERHKEASQGCQRAANSFPIADAISDWLSAHADKKISAGRDAQAAAFLLDFWGPRMVSDISPETVNGYIIHRRCTGKSCRAGAVLSDTTIRLELATLRAAINWCVEHERLDRAPKIGMPNKAPAKDRWLTSDEADALLDACREPYLRLFVMIGLYTGARRQAILDLRWIQVDLDRRLMLLNPPGRAQTSKRRPPIPIADPLFDALTKAKADTKTPWVIELTEEQAYRIKAEALAPVGNLKKGFAAACVRAGLADVTPHTLRHTCGSWLAQAGVPLLEISAWLGHSHGRTTELYAHLSPDHLRAGAQALSRVRK
jgi:integrase